MGDLNVGIDALKSRQKILNDDADAIEKPLLDESWDPYALVITEAMPGNLKLLIKGVARATNTVRTSLKNGAASCRGAADALGAVGGIYEAQEETHANRSRSVNGLEAV